MANQDVGEDTLVADADAGAQQDGEEAQTGTDNGEGGDDAAQPKLVFGKYKSVEEAEKGYKELEHKLHGQGREMSDLKREFETLKQQAELKSLLSEIVKVKEEKKTPVDFESFAGQVGQEFLDNPKQGIAKILGAVNTWQAQDRDTLLSEIKSLRSEISSLQSGVEERVERADPFYEQNKATIDRLVKGGMNLKGAKEFVREMLSETGADQRQTPPPQTRGVRSAVPAGKVESYWASPDERAQFVMEHGEEVAKAMESDYAMRAKNGTKVRK